MAEMNEKPKQETQESQWQPIETLKGAVKRLDGIDNGTCKLCHTHRYHDTEGNEQPCPNANCLSRRVSAALSEIEADIERLEVLMQHPDNLWLDGSGTGGDWMYSGADVEGKGIWHDNPRAAVDDIIRRYKVLNKEHFWEADSWRFPHGTRAQLTACQKCGLIWTATTAKEPCKGAN